jgi:hypothetical protein
MVLTVASATPATVRTTTPQGKHRTATGRAGPAWGRSGAAVGPRPGCTGGTTTVINGLSKAQLRRQVAR